MYKEKEIAVLKAYTELAFDISILTETQRKHLKACLLNAVYNTGHISTALKYYKDTVEKQLNIIIP